MRNINQINQITKIDFSAIRERAIDNVRQDLIKEWSGRFDAMEIADAFDAVLRAHRSNAVVEDYLPLLVENEMKDRLFSGDLFPSAA